MKILAATFVYNERPHLPSWKKYYESEGCELFVLNNESTDGTEQWLKENNVPYANYNTDGEFHLHKLQDELMKHIDRIKPDWVVYTGADLYHIPAKGLRKAIEEADLDGYNQIKLLCVNIVSTGEKHGVPLQAFYHRGGYYRDLTMIAKYGEGFQIRNDNIGLQEENCLKLSGVSVNYGGCKTKKEQEDKLRRREKAWRNGLPQNIGKHFLANKKMGWITQKVKTKNFRALPEWEFIKRTL